MAPSSSSLRSLHRLSSLIRSSSSKSNTHFSKLVGPHKTQTITTLSSSSPSSSSTPFKHLFYISDRRSPLFTSIGSIRNYSADLAAYPDIKDQEIKNVFKDFMAADWSELPNTLITDASKVLSKTTEDTDGKEALKNVFRAAEAVEEFTGTLETLRMAIDDSVGLSGEDVKQAPEEFVNALKVAYDRYTQYLESFGPEEYYLKKKVETQLGTRMIHLKMRCSGIGAEWGKVTVLGTSGIAGSYVEQRGP